MTLPRLEDAINAGVNAKVRDLHTALPGTILSFDTSTQLAEIQPAIQRIYSNDRAVDLPKIINAPVAIWRGGGFSMTYPIKEGDECLIVFSERSLDRWIEEGEGKKPMHKRTHNLSDGIAFVCLSSKPNAVPDYSDSDLQIKSDSGNAVITLKSDGNINIKGNGATVDIAPNSDVQNADDVKINSGSATVEVLADGNIKADNGAGNIGIDPSGNVQLGNDNALLKLFSSGKFEAINNSDNVSLFDILSSLLQALAADGVNHDGFKALTKQSTYASLKAQLDKFIP